MPPLFHGFFQTMATMCFQVGDEVARTLNNSRAENQVAKNLLIVKIFLCDYCPQRYTFSLIFASHLDSDLLTTDESVRFIHELSWFSFGGMV